MVPSLVLPLFQHYARDPGARPSADRPLAFVASINAIYVVCLAIMSVALAASLMRGRTRIEAPASSSTT